MTVARPMILLLLPVAGAFVVLSLRARGYDRRRLLELGVLRMLLAAAAVLAAAGFALFLRSPARYVIFLVDDSPSFAGRMDRAQQLVDERITRLDPNDVAVVFHFSRTARRQEPGKSLAAHREEATDIAAALDAAAAAVPSDHPAAVFLLSEGCATRGDTDAAAMRLAARRIPITIPRPSAEPPADVRVAALDAPESIGRNTLFRLDCRIEATRTADVDLEISRDDVLIHRGTVHVTPDVPTVVPLLQKLDVEKLHVYTARVTWSDDRFERNNTLSTPVLVRAPPLVLYLTGYPGKTPVESLIGRLPRYRFRRLASGAALTDALMAEASLVILDNFPAQALGPAGDRLARYVRDAGGGLVMVGGPASFGAGGYIDTAVDAVLPVHCDPRDARKKPLALVVVLDASGSMGENGGRKIVIARSAAARTLSRLGPKDVAGVLAFNVSPRTVIPLGRVADAAATARALARIHPDGGTNVFPALHEALDTLHDVKAPLRHVLLLSDGKSRPGDAADVIRRYTAAGVTLSVVATGEDVDRALLSGLADATGGTYAHTSDITRIPELFMKDLRRIDGPLVRTGYLAVEATGAGTLLTGLDLTTLPTVSGANRTRLRDGARMLLKHTVKGGAEPILATRRIGLGRATALMASFERDWVGAFTTWQSWPRLWADVMDGTHRARASQGVALDVNREGGTFAFTATLDHAADVTRARMLSVRVASSEAGSIDVPLVRTGVRTWTGRAETDVEAVVSATLTETGAAGHRTLLSRYLPASYPPEYRRLRPRTDVLERIARLTGGRIVDDLDAFRTSAAPAPRARRDLTAWLIALVLTLFVTELVGRALGRF